MALGKRIVLQLYLPKVTLTYQRNASFDLGEHTRSISLKWLPPFAPTKLRKIPTEFSKTIVLDLFFCETSLLPGASNFCVNFSEFFQLLRAS